MILVKKYIHNIKEHIRMISVRKTLWDIYSVLLQGHAKWVVLISSWVVRLPVTLFCLGLHVGGFFLPTKSTEKS